MGTISAAHPAAAPALPPLRRDARLLGWALSHGLSSIGDHLFTVALVYTAAQLTSPATVGVIVACATLPQAAVGLFAGALVDRTDARRVIIASTVAQILVLAVALAVLLPYGPSVTLLVVLALAAGVATAFDGPASFAFPRQLRPVAEMTQVAGLRQLVGRVATIGGPPLGGLMVAVFGLAGALTADLAALVLVALVLLLIRPRWPRERSGGDTILRDLRDGLAYVWSTPQVRGLVLALAGLNVCAAPVVAVGLALRTTSEQWGPATLGLLMGSIGGAAVVGTLVMLRWRPRRPVLVGLLFLLGQAVALSVVGFAPLAGVLGATILIGLTAGLASPLLAGAFQATVADAYVARAGSVTALSDSVLVPLSLTGFGVLVQVADIAVACAVCGCLLLVQLLYSLSRPAVRTLRQTGVSG